MPRPKVPTDEEFEQIAELKATGKSWESIARDMNLSVSTLRRWRTGFADRWAPCFRRAEMELFSDALAEAVNALRKQLRGEEPEIIREAAKQLLGFRVQLQKLLPQDAPRDALFTESDLEVYANESKTSKTVAGQTEEDDPRCAA